MISTIFPGRSSYLPSIEDDGKEFKPAETSLPTGTESILFVDDEAFQADLGQRMLKKGIQLFLNVLCPPGHLQAFTTHPRRANTAARLASKKSITNPRWKRSRATTKPGAKRYPGRLR